MYVNKIENTIGYTFSNGDLLQQAFVRRSYSEEKGGQNNEVLEFIGDKALDLAVIRIMMERFGRITADKQWQEFKLTNPKYFKTKYSEGKFTDIKKDLVQKKALAKCMDRLGFNSELIMGKGDRSQNIQDQDSVKEDLFEAIIGAVAIDCDYNMDTITDVVKTMIDFDAYFSGEDESDDENYVGLLQTWCQKSGYELPEYKYDERYDGYSCVVRVELDDCNYEGYGEGKSKAKARMAAAEDLYCELQDKGYITNEIEEAIGEASYDESLRQINELVQKGLINKPTYEYNQEYDENGNQVWSCVISIDGVDESFVNHDSKKKEAQKASAYEMLLYLMGQYPDDEDANDYDDDYDDDDDDYYDNYFDD